MAQELNTLHISLKRKPSLFRKRMLVAMIVLIFSAILIDRILWADDEKKGVLAAGVIHNIAPDRKVERVGGIMQPEPLDLYLKRLFEQMYTKMDVLDERLQRIEAVLQRGGPIEAAEIPDNGNVGSSR